MQLRVAKARMHPAPPHLASDAEWWARYALPTLRDALACNTAPWNTPRRPQTPRALQGDDGFVLPRPIAWVTTIGPTGVVNAAPFSFFNVFCEDPPLCMFAANLRPDGRVKDTVINIRRPANSWST